MTKTFFADRATLMHQERVGVEWLAQKADRPVIKRTLPVHDRAGEDKFIADGFGIDRRDVVYNDFILVGPASDPAQICGLKSVRQALSRIAEAAALFASRDFDWHIRRRCDLPLQPSIFRADLLPVNRRH